MWQKKSSLKDLFIIALKLPWWVSLILAVVTFIVFKQIATMEVTLQKDQGGASLDGLGEHVLKNLLVGISFFLQYLIPGVLIAGACTIVA